MKKVPTKPLQIAITDAARNAFTELRQTHPKEKFYAYALYTSDAASYIVASANSEEGLLRRAAKYEAKEKKGIKEHARALRWHAPDWDFHSVTDKHFDTAQDLLDARPDVNELDDDKTDKEVDLRFKLFVAALKALDDEGFFGRGKERQKVTLLLTMGDQSTKFLLECAQQLNPKKVYDAFSKPFLRTTTGKYRPLGSTVVYETKGVALSRNGKVLATAGDGYLFVVSLTSLKEILKLKLHYSMGATSIALSPDGSQVAIGWQSLMDEDAGGATCWNIATRKVVCEIKNIKEGAYSVDFAPNGSTIAIAAMDGNVRVLRIDTGELIWKSAAHKIWVQCVRFSPDGKLLASCDRGKSVRFWDPTTGKALGQIAGSGDAISFSNNGKWLAIASGAAEKRDRVVSIWDVAKKKLVKRLEAVKRSRFRVPVGPDDYEDVSISGASFSQNDQYLVITRSNPASAVLWDWQNEQELIWMNPDWEHFENSVFLPDGKTVAISGRSLDGPPLLLWDVSEVTAKK